jgi:hypothetical protein
MLAAATQEQTAAWVQLLKEYPLQTIVVVLWGALSTVAWWAARTQREDALVALRREREICQRLERDLDRAREETERVRREHLQDLVKLAMVTEGVVRLRDELELKKQKRGAP